MLSKSIKKGSRSGQNTLQGKKVFFGKKFINV